jgi:hypothetical protein
MKKVMIRLYGSLGPPGIRSDPVAAVYILGDSGLFQDSK